MKNICLGFLFVLCLLWTSLKGQDTVTVFYDAKTFTLLGKSEPTPQHYHRIDTSKYVELKKNVKKLLAKSAGLMVAFKTNSTKIVCKWKVSNYYAMSNLSPVAQKGLDIYAKLNGKWVYAGSGRPSGKNQSLHTLISDMVAKETEYLIYLPLYSTLEHLEIGIDSNAVIQTITNPFEKKIAVYGSSITQGASASRPGMLYTSRMGRDLNAEFFNLGLNASGTMEKTAADMFAHIKADVFVLDCAANPSPDQIMQNTAYMVTKIREMQPNKPIVMIQSVIRESGNLNIKVRNKVSEQNKKFKNEYEKLIKQGFKELYLIEADKLLGDDHEGTIDGVHPNDIGFSRMIDVIQPVLKRLIH